MPLSARALHTLCPGAYIHTLTQAYPAKAARLQSVVDTANKEHQALAALQPVWRRVVDIETREMRDLKDKLVSTHMCFLSDTACVRLIH